MPVSTRKHVMDIVKQNPSVQRYMTGVSHRGHSQ